METQDGFFCSALARETGTQPFGTAGTYALWLLVEYARPYGAYAVEDFWRDELAGAVHEPVSAYPQSRTLLIKQREGAHEGIRAFFAVTSEETPRLYQFQLGSYGELLSLDLDALVRGDAQYEAQRRHDPLYVVCTNGRRDPCCAKHGVNVYNELRHRVGEAAWECSHIGGHRFAATGVLFPHGLVFGQVQPSEVFTLVEMYARGDSYYEKARGRSCYTREVQVAEHFLRERSGVRSLGAYLLERVAQEANMWRVRFRSGDGYAHEVTFTQALSDWETYTSCDATEKKRDLVHTLVAYDVLRLAD